MAKRADAPAAQKQQGRSGIMAAVHLNGLTPTNAERALARLWYALEEHDIASPQVMVHARYDDRVDIELTFRSERDADAAEALLRDVSHTSS